MSPKEAAILTCLVKADGKTRSWHNLRELGAQRGSHHTVTAARMVQKGWVARESRGKGAVRPAWAYMITAAGQQALYNHFLPAIEKRRLRLAAEASP